MRNVKDNNKSDTKDDTEQEVRRFTPIVAKATELDEKGVTTGDEKLIKIEIPLEEDVNKVNDIVNTNKLKSRNRTINKVNNEGEQDMDENDVVNIMKKVLGESKKDESIESIVRTSDNLVESNNDIKTKMSDFSDKMNALGDLVSSNMLKTNNYMEALNKSQGESCVGVDCLKNNIAEMNDTVDDIRNKTKTALCAGENGCNAQIPIGSSFCPNCGKKIMKWTGKPEWRNYKDRK